MGSYNPAEPQALIQHKGGGYHYTMCPNYAHNRIPPEGKSWPHPNKTEREEDTAAIFGSPAEKPPANKTQQNAPMDAKPAPENTRTKFEESFDPGVPTMGDLMSC